jgi:hypothetical protein
MKLQSISSIILGGTIGIAGTVSLVIDILTAPEPMKLLIDIVVMLMGFMTAYQGFTAHLFETMVAKKMEAEWDYKMKPVIDLITITAGKVNSLEENALETNLKVSHTLDQLNNNRIENIDIIPGASFKFIIKSMMLLTFTFSALVFVSEYPLGIIHYFLTVLFVAWFALITSEYKLWGNTNAMVIGVMPVLIIPTLAMLLDTLMGINNMIGLMFVTLFIYTYSYYTWASYTTTGYQLISLKPIKQLLRR